jgi:hypothetical protein
MHDPSQAWRAQISAFAAEFRQFAAGAWRGAGKAFAFVNATRTNDAFGMNRLIHPVSGMAAFTSFVLSQRR